MYLCNRHKPNAFSPNLTVYMFIYDEHYIHNSLIIEDVLCIFFGIRIIDQTLLLPPYYLPVCQLCEIRQHLSSKKQPLKKSPKESHEASMIKCSVESKFSLPSNLAVQSILPSTTCMWFNVVFDCGFFFMVGLC